MNKLYKIAGAILAPLFVGAYVYALPPATPSLVERVTGGETSLPSLLRQMPEQRCNQLLLTRTNLLDLIDTYEAHASTPIRNRLGELVNIDSLTNDCCQLHLAPHTTATFALTPDGEHILLTLTTQLDGVPITTTQRFSRTWE